jgi:DNA-binding CsgD family transcriptional regulator
MTIQTSDLPSREYLAQFIRTPEAKPTPPTGRRGFHLTDGEIARIRQLKREGFKPAAISEMTGRNERTIRYYLHNAPKRTFRTIPYAVMRRAGRLFRAGGTVAEVARILGRTRESVKHIRRRLGLDRRVRE